MLRLMNEKNATNIVSAIGFTIAIVSAVGNSSHTINQLYRQLLCTYSHKKMNSKLFKC